MIPNIIHFVFGLSKDFGGRPFSLIHYLAIRSAYECNQPDRIYFHHRHEPTGEWWEKAKKYLTLIPIKPPKEIFGNPLLHYAHVADVVRLEALLKYGGIYLDMDVLCLNSFGPLLRHKTVMGKEGSGGLCNAVILAEPEAVFIRRWYEEYRTFRSKGKDEYWSEHSVSKPAELAQTLRAEIYIVNRFAFFWPVYYRHQLLWGVSAQRHWLERLSVQITQPFTYLLANQASYCIHLYESLIWDNHLKDLTSEKMRTMNRSFGWLFKKFLP